MRNWLFRTATGIGLAAALAVMATPRPAHAFIHEIIAAICRAPAGDTEPPGQSLPSSKAFTRALLATGFIDFIEETATETIIHFDPNVPNSTCRFPARGPTGKRWC
jgi:hypothetical protein